MYCSKCGNPGPATEKFCRSCGVSLEKTVLKTYDAVMLKDPDELTSNGIGSVIVGDGLFMVVVILSVSNTPISSFLWLLLLIPAFFFFGKGFADVLLGKQIHRRIKEMDLLASSGKNELPPAQGSIVDLIRNSGNLITARRSTAKTTRELQ